MTPKRLALAIAAVAVGITLLACSSGGTGDGGEPIATSAGGAAPAATVAAKATYHQPKPADFMLTVKILEKKCFGSAGCNVTYRVDLAQTGGAGLDPDKTYELIYEVRGLEDTSVGTMEITGDKYSRDEKEFGSTSSSSKKLTAVVTSVTER